MTKSAQELFSLKDKVALITGGSRGMGREMALAFAKAGADIIVVSRKLNNCEAVAAEVAKMGRRALPYACHVGHWEELDGLVNEVYRQFGKIDILVNNAGMSPVYPSLVEVSEKLWDSTISLNLKGPFRLSALVGSRMAAGNGGSIINVSSTAAVRPSPRETPYGAAKAGIHALTFAFAKAYGPKVRVNCIMPGPILTDISKTWDMDMLANIVETSSDLKRAGQPEEIIGAALYFASDASSFTTGTVLPVDGGYGPS